MSLQLSEHKRDDTDSEENLAKCRMTTSAEIKSPRSNMLGNFAAIIVLSIAFCTLVLISMQSTATPPIVIQTLELSQRPIWIGNLPYAPVDGLTPDLGQQPQILPAN